MDAVVYIDGFNLYYGALKRTPYKWLDIQALSSAIAPRNCTVKKIRYFTAKVKPNPRSPHAHTDQQAYLSAISAACSLLEIKYGTFLTPRVWAAHVNPPPANVQIFKHEEKGTDVSLAAHLVNDAWSGLAQAAILVSNDSDLAEAVELVQARGVNVYWFPPTLTHGRYPSAELSRVVAFQRSIYRGLIRKCQLPDPVIGTKGPIRKPIGW